MYMRLFLIYFSKFLYDLTRDDGTNPSRSVVQRWLKSIGSKIGVVMGWTQRMDVKDASGGVPERTP